MEEVLIPDVSMTDAGLCTEKGETYGGAEGRYGFIGTWFGLVHLHGFAVGT